MPPGLLRFRNVLKSVLGFRKIIFCRRKGGNIHSEKVEGIQHGRRETVSTKNHLLWWSSGLISTTVTPPKEKITMCCALIAHLKVHTHTRLGSLSHNRRSACSRRACSRRAWRASTRKENVTRAHSLIRGLNPLDRPCSQEIWQWRPTQTFRRSSFLIYSLRAREDGSSFLGHWFLKVHHCYINHCLQKVG